MSLKIDSRPNGRTLFVRGTVRGQSLFESTGTSDPERGEAYRAKREAELWDRSVYGTKATVTFAHAVESYLRAEDRHPHTKELVGRLLDHFKTVPLRQINQEAVDRAYSVLLTKRAGPATKLRAVLTPLRAIMSHAAVRGWCERPAFETPRQPKAKTTFLRPDQATALVQGAAPHLRPLLVFLLGTGARLSEALELDWSSVDLAHGRAVLLQKQGTERHADLPPVVIATLSALPHRKGRSSAQPATQREATGRGLPQHRPGRQRPNQNRLEPRLRHRRPTGHLARTRPQGPPGHGVAPFPVRLLPPRPPPHLGHLALLRAQGSAEATRRRRMGNGRDGGALCQINAGFIQKSDNELVGYGGE